MTPDCPDLQVQLADAERAVIEARFASARDDLDRAAVVFGCGDWADSTSLARYWLIEGALYNLQGDAAQGDQAFAAAARVDPAAWIDDFGEELKTRWRLAGSASVGQGGDLELDPAPTGLETRLDGQEAEFPVHTVAGWHLVQVGRQGPQQAAVVQLAEGGTVIIPLTATPLSADEMKPQHPWWTFAGAGVFAVAAGATAYLARTEEDPQRQADSLAQLQAAHNHQVAFAVASYASGGAAAGMIALHFAL